MFFSRSPGAVQRLVALGREFESLGHFRWAEWIFKRVIYAGPPSSTAFFILGRIQTQRGKLEEGKKNYVHCLEIKPDFYQCRVSYFELCRKQYWTKLPAGASRATPDRETPMDVHQELLRTYHRRLSQAIFSQMWFEIGRFDPDDPEISVLEHLEDMQKRVRGRAGRKFSKRLSDSRRLLEQAYEDLSQLKASINGADRCRARVFRLKEPPIDVVGLRDGDDITGAHLEIILEGAVSFVPLDALRSIEFGKHSDFTEATIELFDGSRRDVVVPTIYYGSHHSAMEELRRGEISMFKELYQGMSIGVGRRVFRGLGTMDHEPLSFRINDIEAIEFRC